MKCWFTGKALQMTTNQRTGFLPFSQSATCVRWARVLIGGLWEALRTDGNQNHVCWNRFGTWEVCIEVETWCRDQELNQFISLQLTYKWSRLCIISSGLKNLPRHAQFFHKQCTSFSICPRICISSISRLAIFSFLIVELPNQYLFNMRAKQSFRYLYEFSIIAYIVGI